MILAGLGLTPSTDVEEEGGGGGVNDGDEVDECDMWTWAIGTTVGIATGLQNKRGTHHTFGRSSAIHNIIINTSVDEFFCTLVNIFSPNKLILHEIAGMSCIHVYEMVFIASQGWVKNEQEVRDCWSENVF